MKALIIGGGIGGLATALFLHRAGVKVDVFEQSNGIGELGVGINILPHAIKELAGLGLLEKLDRVGIRTYELIYQNRFGQVIWRETRGLDAGYEVPQFSIHRGRLQGVLHEAVRERIGDTCIRVGHRCAQVDQTDRDAVARFEVKGGHDRLAEHRGDIIVAADGIHSVVRSKWYPGEGPPRWNGIMLWRGATEWKPFLTGRSMIVAGGMDAKLVLYPISSQTQAPGKVLMNWAVAARLGDANSPPPRREDWSRPGKIEELLPFVEDRFHLNVLDPLALIRATPEFYEYPMCDRDPVPQWTDGRITLLGDAAHPMYPVGSNGASQAVLDARCLADKLSEADDVRAALAAYDAERRPVTAKIVRDNRGGGPERVIDLVSQRAPQGFDKLDDVASPQELEAIVKGYSKLAGFSQEEVNRPDAGAVTAS